MANSVTIRTTAPGAKQVAGEMKGLRAQIAGLGTKTGGPLGGMLGGLAAFNPISLAAMAGAGALTAALGDGIRGALEEEKQIGRLNQALKNNIKDWDGSNQRMEDAATKAMDLSFADDDARESLIKLVTATGNEEESIKDLNLAMDIARGRNIDLGAATDIVIKANMGNVGALRRMGIEVENGATKMEILQELTERYAGQAKEYAESTAGKFESAQKKVDNAMEDFGHTVVNTTAGLLSAGDALRGDTGAAEDFFHSLGNLVPGFGMIGDAIGNAADQLGSRGAKDALGHSAGDMIAQGIADGLEAGKPKIATETDALMGVIQKNLDKQAAAAKEFGDNFTDDLAGSVRGNKDTVKDAMDDLMFAINHPLKYEKEIARIEGALSSNALKEGLASNNPYIRAVAQQQQRDLQQQWEKLTGTAYQEGVDASDALERGLGTFKMPKILPKGLLGSYLDKANRAGSKLGLASGGYLKPGERKWVGEEGPEIAEGGPGGTRVYNHSDSMAMARGSGTTARSGGTQPGAGAPMSVQVQVMLSTRDLTAMQRHYSNLQSGKANF